MSAEEKALTGYPSIDKPWLKYYSEEAINAKVPELTMYEYLWERNKDYLDNTAIMYFGKKMTYRKFFSLIDCTASALAESGVEKGDVVSIMSLNTPETLIVYYALNRIGAIASMEYITHTPEMIKKSIEGNNPKMIFVLDMIYEKCKDLVESLDIEVVLLPLSDSMPLPAKIIVGLKNGKKKYSGITTFRQFSKRATGVAPLSKDPYAPCVLLGTSGTTGISKMVVLNSYNINSVASHYPICGMDVKREDSFVGIAPLFLSFGLSLCNHMPLTMGVTLIITLTPDKGFDDVRKYKANHILVAPVTINNLFEKEQDLSFLKTVAVGGESLKKAQREKVNEFLEKHNASARLITGYGMTEVSATAVTEMNHIRRDGSVGIPMLKANVKIVDTETNRELEYHQSGEIMVSSPGLMMEYLDNASETEKVIEVDENGTRWMHTGDIGRIDEDGFVYIEGRIKRIYLTKQDAETVACKMFPEYIENVLSECEIVKNNAVVAIPDDVLVNIPIAFVVLKEKNENAQETICKHFEGIAAYNIPKKFYFVEEIPCLSNGKKDYKKLEAMAKGNL